MSEGSFHIAGWFFGFDGKRWQRPRIDKVNEPTRLHPYRRYHSRSYWFGPFCVVARGRFVWTPPS